MKLKQNHNLIRQMAASIPMRVSTGNSSLYSTITVPTLENRSGELYNIEIRVTVNDLIEEGIIARELVKRINQHQALCNALQAARVLLDSVAYLSTPGDTDAILKVIRSLH